MGDACEFGGLRIETGLDTNGDGSLVGDEINSTHYICNPFLEPPPLL